MSNSATSAAKRRRAGPLLSSPLFLPPQSFQSNKPVAENNFNLQSERSINMQPIILEQQQQNQQQQNQQQQNQQQQNQQPTDSKFMTIQQVINLITMRLITVENFMNEFGDKPREIVQINSESETNVDYNKIAEICKSLMGEHIAEFDHRYAILAEEISNLKNITLSLQNYTMEVNKTLMEERLSKKDKCEEKPDPEKEFSEDVPHIEFQFESETECQETTQQEEESEMQKRPEFEEEEEGAFSLNIISKKYKEDEVQKHIESEEELAF